MAIYQLFKRRFPVKASQNFCCHLEPARKMPKGLRTHQLSNSLSALLDSFPQAGRDLLIEHRMQPGLFSPQCCSVAGIPDRILKSHIVSDQLRLFPQNGNGLVASLASHFTKRAENLIEPARVFLSL